MHVIAIQLAALALAAPPAPGAVPAPPKPSQERLITAKDMGVKVDGTTDDAAAFAKVISDAISTGADVVLPGGTLNIGSTITIKNGADLRIRGVGNRKTYLRWKGPSGSPVLRMVN